MHAFIKFVYDLSFQSQSYLDSPSNTFYKVLIFCGLCYSLFNSNIQHLFSCSTLNISEIVTDDLWSLNSSMIFLNDLLIVLWPIISVFWPDVPFLSSIFFCVILVYLFKICNCMLFFSKFFLFFVCMFFSLFFRCLASAFLYNCHTVQFSAMNLVRVQL